MTIDGLTYDTATGEFSKGGKILGGTASKYKVIRWRGKLYKAHQIAWYFMTGTWSVYQIDHKNRNKHDNKFENLRELTNSQNCQNQIGSRVNNLKTGLQGVKVHKRKGGTVAYRAAIQVSGKDIHLGLFETAEEAHQVYMDKKLEILNGF